MNDELTGEQAAMLAECQVRRHFGMSVPEFHQALSDGRINPDYGAATHLVLLTGRQR